MKLCLWILSISTVIFLLIFGAIYHYVSEEVRRDVSATANAKLDYILSSLGGELTNTEISADNLLGISHSPLVSHSRDSIYSLMEHFLSSNPRIQGVTMGYKPNVLPDHKDGFCPYVMRTPEGYKRMDIGDVKDYKVAYWFAHTLQVNKANWTKPFYETNGSIITSYCLPVSDNKGQVYGVLAFDLNLNDFNASLQNIKPYPNAMLTVVDGDGTFVAHPNPDFILKESIPSLLKTHGEGANRTIYDSIKEGKRGNDNYQGAHGRTFVFYAPEKKTGWTVTLEVPESDIVASLLTLRGILIMVMLLGALLLVGVCFIVVSHITRPLEQFARVARGISHGDFQRPLPEVHAHNELYDLRQALASMKTSLNEYITQLETTTASKATIESELNTARRIQMAMVPKTFPPYPERKELDIYGSLTPAKAVGGDLYDFILDGDDFYFCIGDVSGKGVPASLFMAITRSLFRNNVIHAKSPAALATLLNNAIAQGNDENMFVTMFIGCCNLKTGLFRCCNCGHNAPTTNGVPISHNPLVIAPQGETHFMRLAPTNLPIGVVQGIEFKEVSMTLQPGVKIMLYTDGITEAENPDAQLYGDDRLLKTLSQIDPNATARQTVDHLMADVLRHADGAEQSDDITMLCMNYVKVL